jgi:hypothetical protein
MHQYSAFMFCIFCESLEPKAEKKPVDLRAGDDFFRPFEQVRLLQLLVVTNIAMENDPFIGLPIKNGDFPWLC